MDEEKELRESLDDLEEDFCNLGVAIELLGEEIIIKDTIEERLNKLVDDIDTWLDAVNSCNDKMREAIKRYNKIKMLNNLR